MLEFISKKKLLKTLEELRDYLYSEDLIFMRGLAELNKLIANCGAKMDLEESKDE